MAVILFLVLTVFTNCEIDTAEGSTNTVKIYSGSFGYDVAYRIDGNKIYSGNSGYEVTYRVGR